MIKLQMTSLSTSFVPHFNTEGRRSSRHVDSSNMHTFYQRYPSEHHWTKDPPLEQVIRNPSQSIRTRHQLESNGEMCTKDAAKQEVRKNESSQIYILLPYWAHDALLESTSSKPYEESSSQVPEGSGNHNSTASTFHPTAEQMETLAVESPIPTAKTSSEARLVSKRVAHQEESPSLDNILSLINRFDDILRVSISSDETIGVEAD
nr:hypothetical protein [Tanacetum cinerariifolium]